MHDAIKYLSNKGFDTQYVTKAVDVLYLQTIDWTIDQFIQEINNTLGFDQSNGVLSELLQSNTPVDVFKIKYLYFYLIQNLLISNKKSQIFEDSDLLLKSLQQSIIFCREHKASLLEQGMGDSDSNSHKKLTKTERAFRIFSDIIKGFDVNDPECRTKIRDQFQEKLDMTASGSLTYYHSTKKRYIEAS